VGEPTGGMLSLKEKFGWKIRWADSARGEDPTTVAGRGLQGGRGEMCSDCGVGGVGGGTMRDKKGRGRGGAGGGTNTYCLECRNGKELALEGRVWG